MEVAMPKQAKSEAVLVRFTPDDKAAITKAAAHEEMSREEYIRAACLAYMALTLNKHALHAALQGAREVMRELEAEGKEMFFGKVKARARG
jgi:uncharacterized protein (DUF1778 family)